jgi:hypothetical protein
MPNNLVRVVRLGLAPVWHRKRIRFSPSHLTPFSRPTPRRKDRREDSI